MQIALPLFDDVMALDAIGPADVLRQIPDFDVVFIGHRRGEVRCTGTGLGLTVDAEFEALPRPDVVVFPGGAGIWPLMQDERVLGWLRVAHKTTVMTTSVCSGALVLGAAGLLDGLTATTHWGLVDQLRTTGAIPVAERVVDHADLRIMTAAGVSSGIDMALRLIERLVDRTAAEAAQLLVEYDPQPHVDSGTITKASDTVTARMTEYATQR